jgi:lysophospholipase L1-like esterase
MSVVRGKAHCRPAGTYFPAGRHRSCCIKVLLFLLGGITVASCAGVAPGERTAPPPAVVTLPATSIMTDRAVLNGTVNPNGSAAEAWFEIGTDPDPSAWSNLSVHAKGNGTAALPFRDAVRGLKPYATYFYRAVARNGSGLRRGEIRAFPTGEYYVAAGDSITAGSKGNNFESRLGDLLTDTRGYPNVVANLGVPGATSAVGSDTISFALSTYPWAKYFLVMYGTNDAFLPGPVPSGQGKRPGDPGYSGSYKESVRKIIAAIRAAGKTPCLAKVPFATRPSVDVASLREYNSVIDELVTEERISVQPPDFFAYFQAHPENLADGVHPNRAGYDAMAEMWMQALNGGITRNP